MTSPRARRVRREGSATRRIRFVGGPLSGAVVDLPTELVDAPPGRLAITGDHRVFDRYRDRLVPEAQVVVAPAGSPAATRTTHPPAAT